MKISRENLTEIEFFKILNRRQELHETDKDCREFRDLDEFVDSLPMIPETRKEKILITLASILESDDIYRNRI